MHSRSRLPFACLAAFALLVLPTACSSEVAKDPNNREIAWSYGPTQGGATQEHLIGSGTQGDGPVAKGWQCRLVDKKRLTIQPFSLAKSHPLFDQVVLVIGLFDQTGAQLATVRSAPVTAANASFSFDVEPDVAAKLWDIVIWYAKP